ncbi:MFS transporter [Pseudoroseomonas cervicalis]|uniref:MFS transporter n=1 Tax=Teichococcus cervicalis TaxID=204525 RepID=UPI0022F18953|nr:MFS transporter [Pseudoroseomonas cervicalis]WBV42557.1 MFS transporter [Pseudoroseomonas cervicalis]
MNSLDRVASRPVWQDSRAVALLMAAMLTTMANATISPALPGLARLFADEPDAALLTRMLVSAPSLSVAILAPLAGLAADRFGRRGLLLMGVVLFVIAGSARLVLPSLPAILVSRLVLGIAVALIMTAQTALVADYFSGADRSALMGLQIAARNFGGLLFISLAGWVASLSPRLPFAIYGLAIVFLPLMWMVITDRPRRSSRTGADAAAGVERSHAWIPLFSALVLLQALTNMLFFIMPTQLPFFLASHFKNSAIMTGSALGVLMLTGGCFALLYPRIQPAIGYSRVFILGYGAMALGFVLLAVQATMLAPFIGGALVGAGYALVSPTFVALVLNFTPASRRGLGGGILTASIFAGQFCSPLLSTPMVSALGYDGLFHGASLLLASMASTTVAVVAFRRLRAASRPRDCSQHGLR